MALRGILYILYNFQIGPFTESGRVSGGQHGLRGVISWPLLEALKIDAGLDYGLIEDEQRLQLLAGLSYFFER
jgi:hypothetical protein